MVKKAITGALILLFTVAVGAVSAAGLTHMEQLGKIMYQEKDFSLNATQSCQTCHHHVAGFADPTNSRDPYFTVVSLGDDGVSKGGRNAPTAAYAGFSPVLQQDERGEYVGGMFWDGRATGWTLGDPLAEQAQGPPLNPVEMNMPSKDSVVQVVRDSNYTHVFYEVFGEGSLVDADLAYDFIALAIAAYERSNEVQTFSSRFDQGNLSEKEQSGMDLFATNCSQCHSMTDVTGKGPLFTNYTYANIGVPVNPLLADNPVDLGLGGFLGDSMQNGKFKVPTLRNVGLSAPYSHNGYFATLKDIVNFKNTRDVGGWEKPEVVANLNTADMGNLGLTDQEVDDVVAFLMTLTD
ncbi:cytochrome-c peroxidase [Desulfosarcina alkanivorans]|uniref:Cytochrome-c peroxidase n=1 Tax=Desulfosarcina alkanivorans TaxID=571177 RepID=A0A5K7YPX9_9BACT|nr:cytochrome c peroxidase [Desulfosarcina alkanivorans]BBO71316.1 cytochrome-c peroxidase [Desulfosarcina alkanivorans]